MNEWISVKDSIPDEEDEVLVTDGTSIWIAEVDGRCWIGYDGVFRITHWMKPELPK